MPGPRPSALLHQPIHRHSQACRWAPFTGNPASRFLMEWGTNQVQTSTIRRPAKGAELCHPSNQKSPHQRAFWQEFRRPLRQGQADPNADSRVKTSDTPTNPSLSKSSVQPASDTPTQRDKAESQTVPGPQEVSPVYRIHRIHRFFTVLTSAEADHRQSGERERWGRLTVESAQSIGNATSFRNPFRKSPIRPGQELVFKRPVALNGRLQGPESISLVCHGGRRRIPSLETARQMDHTGAGSRLAVFT